MADSTPGSRETLGLWESCILAKAMMSLSLMLSGVVNFLIFHLRDSLLPKAEHSLLASLPATDAKWSRYWEPSANPMINCHGTVPFLSILSYLSALPACRFVASDGVKVIRLNVHISCIVCWFLLIALIISTKCCYQWPEHRQMFALAWAIAKPTSGEQGTATSHCCGIVILSLSRVRSWLRVLEYESPLIKPPPLINVT